jgi:membrane-bound lytic murein transglycosylase B
LVVISRRSQQAGLGHQSVARQAVSQQTLAQQAVAAAQTAVALSRQKRLGKSQFSIKANFWSKPLQAGLRGLAVAWLGLQMGQGLAWSGSLAEAPPPPSKTTLPANANANANGRQYPTLPQQPQEIASLLSQVEAALRAPTTPTPLLPNLGHQQQVIYRVLARRKPLAKAVLELLPPRWQRVAQRQLEARRQFLAMQAGRARPSLLPAWRVQAPAPATELLAYYHQAAATTGIAWEVLAAINLVESAMGRIDGVSVANAHGPMQFLPSTWAEAGIGRGDIRNPRDAIPAAARYLVRRGGLKDIRKALWGYNNSDYYGRAVLIYAALLREDPAAYRGFYNWEVHLATSAGDVWLPVGYSQPQPISGTSYLRRMPSSAPQPGTSGF